MLKRMLIGTSIAAALMAGGLLGSATLGAAHSQTPSAATAIDAPAGTVLQMEAAEADGNVNSEGIDEADGDINSEGIDEADGDINNQGIDEADGDINNQGIDEADGNINNQGLQEGD